MSHTTVVEFPCAPGKGAELLEILLSALTETLAYEGCEGVETYTDSDNPDLILLWEKWATRANQESYLAWRMETGFVDVVGPFLGGELRVLHLSAAD